MEQFSSLPTFESSAGLIFKVRPYTPADENLVKGTWKGSHLLSTPPELSKSTHNWWMERVTTEVIENPATQWRIACYEDDPEEVIGWACRGEDVVHYVFTKQAFRGAGVARILVADWPRTADHWTLAAAECSNRKWLYRPRTRSSEREKINARKS